MRKTGWLPFLLVLVLSGCLPAPLPAPVPPTPARTQIPAPSQTPSPAAMVSAFPSPPSPTAMVSASPSPVSPTVPLPSPSSVMEPTTPVTSVCSPLEGVSLSEINTPGLLKNPFVAPRAGYDDGHPGIDLAFWTRPDGKAMLGLPVHSVLDGVVAAALPNRQPFGNALIIETSLDRLPPAWLTALNLPAPRHDLQPSFSLTCPDTSDFKFLDHMSSIYLLYAHLEQPAGLKPGDQVSCGQTVGAVGTTGKSVNPHLHLEARHGPSGVIFASMGHYETSATQAEMRSYCLWRISGAFQPFNPLNLIELVQPQR